MTNPLLAELNNLSPGAKTALASAAGSPPQQTQLNLSAPSQIHQPPAIGAPPPQQQLPQGPMPQMSAPQAPAIRAPKGTSAGDQAEQSRLLSSGSGVDQIQSPWARIPLKILEGIGNISPITRGLQSAIPGTDDHHQALLRQNEGNVQNDLNTEEKQAQTHNLQSQPAFHQLQADLAQSKQNLAENKLDETTRQHDQQLREHGFKLDETGNMVPLPYAEMSGPQQAVQDLKGAQEEEQEATAALRKVQADPNSPQARAAQARIDGARQAREIAIRRLTLSERQTDSRINGTDPSGTPLPGALLTDDGRPVGSSFSSNVRPTTTQRDAAGRAEIGEKIRQRLIAQLGDPAIRAQIGPLMGRAKDAESFVGSLPENLSEFGNDLKSYAAFQAGMHPVRGIGGLQYFDKVMGGLGQTPEQMMGKFNSNHNTAQDVISVGQPKTVGSNAASGPKEGDTKKNSSGDDVVYKGGKWQPK